VQELWEGLHRISIKVGMGDLGPEKVQGSWTSLSVQWYVLHKDLIRIEKLFILTGDIKKKRGTVTRFWDLIMLML
jgi:hypothetical protein